MLLSPGALLSGHSLRRSLDLGTAFASLHSSTIYGLTRGGLWTPFASNVAPRTDLGLQVEPTATNLITPSEGTAALPSAVASGTIAASSAVGPLGGTSFYAAVTGTGPTSGRQKNTAVANDGATYTGSVHIRKAAGGQVTRWLLGLTGGTTTVQAFSDVNLTTGAIVGGTGAAGAVVDGGDYWRVPVKITNNTTGNLTLFVQVLPSTSGAASCEAGGIQLETGSFMTSYQPTAGSTATRAAQTTSRTIEATFTKTQGHIALTGRAPAGASGSNQVLWQVDDGSSSNRMTVYRNTSKNLVCEIVSAGATQSSRSLGPLADSASFSVDFAWAGATASYSCVIATVPSAPFYEYGVTVPSGLTTERAGCDTAGNQWGGTIAGLVHYRGGSIVTPFFGDSFNRADTAAGSLGTPPSGVAYTMYGAYAGAYPLPAATAGNITSKAFVEGANNVTYATQNLAQTIHNISMKVSWTSAGGVTALSTPTMIISANNKIIDTMLHITTNRSVTNLQKRIAGGAFVTIASITYSPALTNGGVLYDVSVSVSGSTATLRGADGSAVSVTDADIPSIIGPYVAWEQFNNSADMVDLATYWNVAASP